MAGAWIVQQRDDLKGDEAFTSNDTTGAFANAHIALVGRASNLDGKVKESDGRITDLTTRLENSIPRLAAKCSTGSWKTGKATKAAGLSVFRLSFRTRSGIRPFETSLLSRRNSLHNMFVRTAITNRSGLWSCSSSCYIKRLCRKKQNRFPPMSSGTYVAYIKLFSDSLSAPSRSCPGFMSIERH